MTTSNTEIINEIISFFADEKIKPFNLANIDFWELPSKSHQHYETFVHFPDRISSNISKYQPENSYKTAYLKSMFNKMSLSYIS